MAIKGKFSPSSYPARNECNGFTPGTGTTDAALAGTRIHRAFETGDLGHCHNDQEKAIAQKAIDTWAPIEMGAAISERELRVVIDLGVVKINGIVDAVAGTETEMTLADLKGGSTAVAPADENLQIKGYAIGLFDRYPKLEKVRTCIIQPARDEVTAGELTRAEAEDVRKYLADLFDRCNVADPELNPGTACKYCAAKPNCRALVSRALIVGEKLGITIPEKLDAKNLPIEWLDEVGLELAFRMLEWAESVKKHCTELAREGEEFEHYQLQQRNRARRINDPQCAFDAVSGVLDVEEFLKAVTVSEPKLRKLIRDKAAKGEGAEAVRLLNTLLEPCMAEQQDKISFLAMKSGTKNKD